MATHTSAKTHLGLGERKQDGPRNLEIEYEKDFYHFGD